MYFTIRDGKMMYPMGTFPVPGINELRMGILAIQEIIDKFQNDENINKYNIAEAKDFDSIVQGAIIQTKNFKKKGFIYFVQDSHGYIKIGKTVDIKSRLKKYVCENSCEVKMIKYIQSEDYTSEEIKFHKMFDHKRHKGERFKLDKNDIDFILSLE